MTGHGKTALLRVWNEPYATSATSLETIAASTAIQGQSGGLVAQAVRVPCGCEVQRQPLQMANVEYTQWLPRR